MEHRVHSWVDMYMLEHFPGSPQHLGQGMCGVRVIVGGAHHTSKGHLTSRTKRNDALAIDQVASSWTMIAASCWDPHTFVCVMVVVKSC